MYLYVLPLPTSSCLYFSHLRLYAFNANPSQLFLQYIFSPFSQGRIPFFSRYDLGLLSFADFAPNWLSQTIAHVIPASRHCNNWTQTSLRRLFSMLRRMKKALIGLPCYTMCHTHQFCWDLLQFASKKSFSFSMSIDAMTLNRINWYNRHQLSVGGY